MHVGITWHLFNDFCTSPPSPPPMPWWIISQSSGAGIGSLRSGWFWCAEGAGSQCLKVRENSGCLAVWCFEAFLCSGTYPSHFCKQPVSSLGGTKGCASLPWSQVPLGGIITLRTLHTGEVSFLSHWICAQGFSGNGKDGNLWAFEMVAYYSFPCLKASLQGGVCSQLVWCSLQG